MRYMENIIIPFVAKTRENLGLGPSQPRSLTFWKRTVFIPCWFTDKLQPMDVSVNRAAKAFLEWEFQDWYANQVLTTSMMNDEELMPVNLSSAEMKHFGAKWLVKMFDHLINNPHLIVKVFIQSGITESISKVGCLILSAVHKFALSMFLWRRSN